MRKLSKRYFVNRWSDPELRPKLSGRLIDDNGCKCVEGDVLSECGYSDDELRAMDQGVADTETARLIDISKTHAVFLRNVNDSTDGCPQDALDTTNGGIERLFGPNAKLVLAFWRYLDAMSPTQWSVARNTARNVVQHTTRDKAWDIAFDTARDVTRDLAQYAARSVGWGIGRYATFELIGLDKIESPYFLPILGLTDPRKQLAEFMVD